MSSWARNFTREAYRVQRSMSVYVLAIFIIVMMPFAKYIVGCTCSIMA